MARRDAYDKLCRLLDDDSLEERIDKPVKDALQDGWVRTLESRRRNGKEIINAQTSQELADAYREDAGLVVQAFQHAYEDARRKLKGHEKLSPQKAAMIREMFSLDNVGVDEIRKHELIEDVAAMVAFEQVESQDLLYNDPRYVTMTDGEKEAVRHFTIAWFLQEAGLPIPNKVQQQISRNRKKYGLALELKQGRR